MRRDGCQVRESKDASDTSIGRSSTPNGIRTRVTTLKEWDPRPLDDGGGPEKDTERGRSSRARVSGMPHGVIFRPCVAGRILARR